MSNKLPDNFDYNSIPVYYCTQCLSLKIRGVRGIEGLDFCEDCNSTSIAQTDIFNWERLFELRYGYNYLKGLPFNALNIYKNGRD